METGHQFKVTVHGSIRNGSSLPPIQKCTTCCFPPKCHCPFCSPAVFKPTKPSKVKSHLDGHLNLAVCVGEYTIHRCGESCRKQPHYHCLYCSATLIKRSVFTKHLPGCYQKLKKTLIQQGEWTQIVQSGELLMTVEDRVIRLDGAENSDDSHDHISIIDSSDSSSCQLVTQNAAKKLKRTTESSKHDQAVQTDTEKPQDCDEYYFMYLVKMFKRLSPQKKAEVRMKMERILFEAEFV